MLGDPPVSKYVACHGREIHYLEWGRADLSPVVLWHGLARNGRDFDALARELAPRHRLIAPDTIGRGFSQWAADPDAEYDFDNYARLAAALCDALGIGTLGWVGTSMGGALGIRLAAGALKGRITRMVLNDIGPELPMPAQQRILDYVGSPPAFDTASELERWLRMVYAPFGYIPGEQWRDMMEASFRRLENGKVAPNYDPRIVRQLVVRPDAFTQWEHYDAVACPTLLLRGESSDVLLPEVAEAMTARGPKAKLQLCAGCGHAPALNVPVQTEAVAAWLAA